MSLHSCPHLMSFFLSRFIICLLSCRPFCFLPCNVPRRTHIFASLSLSSWDRCLLYHLPSPLSATSFMLTSSAISIHFPTLRVDVSMVHSFPSQPRFDRHSPISITLPLVRVLFTGLVVHYTCVSYYTCACFHFLLQNPALLIFASLHTLSLCPLRLADGIRILRISLSPSPSFPSPKLIRTPIYNQPPILPHTDPS